MSDVKFYFEKEIDPLKIKETWEKAFDKKFNADYWDWFFKLNPITDKIYIGYIMIDNILASYAAVQPSYINLEGKGKIKSGNMNMWMTHPDFQKKGYIVTILNELFKELQKDGYICLYSFPTRIVTWELMKKYLDWTDVEELIIFKINKNIEIQNLEHNISFNNGEINSDIINQVEKMNILKQRISICRTKEYLNWRLLENPLNKYFFANILYNREIAGTLIYKLYNNDVDIMEFFFNKEYYSLIYEMLLQGSKYLINKNNYSNCNIWTINNSKLYNYLLSKNCLIDPLKTYLGYVNLQPQIELNKSTDWHISFMDSDIY